jgi:hypothetical protein
LHQKQQLLFCQRFYLRPDFPVRLKDTYLNVTGIVRENGKQTLLMGQKAKL